MDGSKYIIATGIDGSLDDWLKVRPNPENSVNDTILHYNKTITLKDNLRLFQDRLESEFTKSSLEYTNIIGWSIGASVALWLSQYYTFQNLILINSFFNRKACLEHRGVFIRKEENLKVSSMAIYNQSIWLISGCNDNKINPNESLKIKNLLKGKNQINYAAVPKGNHKLSSLAYEIREVLTKISGEQ